MPTKKKADTVVVDTVVIQKKGVVRRAILSKGVIPSQKVAKAIVPRKRYAVIVKKPNFKSVTVDITITEFKNKKTDDENIRDAMVCYNKSQKLSHVGILLVEIIDEQK